MTPIAMHTLNESVLQLFMNPITLTNMERKIFCVYQIINAINYKMPKIKHKKTKRSKKSNTHIRIRHNKQQTRKCVLSHQPNLPRNPP